MTNLKDQAHKNNFKKHHRRSIRLPRYDYTRPGAYFVTICAHQRECLFGQVVDGEMLMNEFGQIVQTEWMQTAVLRPYVVLDVFVVMPNHVHGILIVTDDHRRGTAPPCPYKGQFGKPIVSSLSTIIRAFKSITTRRINEVRDTPGAPIWQRNYYERIIRSEQALNYIRDYIVNNPLHWHLDQENPLNTRATHASPLRDDFAAWLEQQGKVPIRRWER